MGPHERQARAEARRHAHRTNPASLSLARSAVELGRLVDEADDARREAWQLRIVLSHLRECEAVESAGDRLRAAWSARRLTLRDLEPPAGAVVHWNRDTGGRRVIGPPADDGTATVVDASDDEPGGNMTPDDG